MIAGATDPTNCHRCLCPNLLPVLNGEEIWLKGTHGDEKGNLFFNFCFLTHNHDPFDPFVWRAESRKAFLQVSFQLPTHLLLLAKRKSKAGFKMAIYLLWCFLAPWAGCFFIGFSFQVNWPAVQCSGRMGCYTTERMLKMDPGAFFSLCTSFLFKFVLWMISKEIR